MTSRYAVVSGLPASGKTTLARQLGALLDLTVLDKDDVLERLFPRSGAVTPDERRRLSRQADREFTDAAIAAPGAVLVSFWRRPELSTTSGTPTEWLESLPDVVEVYCDCSPETAATRFANRARHPAHGDAAGDEGERLTAFRRLHEVGPLGLPALVVANTEGPVDMERLVRLLRLR